MMNIKQMRGVGAVVDAFIVENDPNPNGRPWLDAILAEKR
jgi:hypothetical protein